MAYLTTTIMAILAAATCVAVLVPSPSPPPPPPPTPTPAPLPLCAGVSQLAVGVALTQVNAFSTGPVKQALATFSFDQPLDDGSCRTDKNIAYEPMANFCDLDTNSQTYETYDDFHDSVTSSVKVSGTFKKFTGSYSHSCTTAKEHLTKTKSVESTVFCSCATGSALLLPGVTPSPALLQFLAAYDVTTQAGAFQLFSGLGDHVTVGGNLMCTLLAQSNTNYEYVKDYSTSKVSQEASISFFVKVDASGSSNQTVDKEYTSETIGARIENRGGQLVAGNQWVDFAQKCTSPGSDPTLGSFGSSDALQLVSVSDFIRSFFNASVQAEHNLSAVADSLDTFLPQWFDRPGCTLPNASNYDPHALVNNGSCIFPKPASLALVDLSCSCGDSCDPQTYNLSLGNNVCPTGEYNQCTSDCHSSGGNKCRCSRNTVGEVVADYNNDWGPPIQSGKSVTDVGETSIVPGICQCTIRELFP